MNTLQQARFIVDKLTEQVDDLPDDQPFNIPCGEVRAVASTLDELLDAVEEFSNIGLEEVAVCLIATEALQDPDPSVVRKLKILNPLQYSLVSERFDRLHKELDTAKPEVT